jgi:hypothetical protein
MVSVHHCVPEGFTPVDEYAKQEALEAIRTNRPSNLDHIAAATAKAERGIREKDNLLIIAARSRAAEIVQALITKGADVGVRDSDGHTALHWAIGLGDESTARVLLLGGADVNARAKGYTILSLAVEKSRPDLVKMLLERGADPNERSAFRRNKIESFPDLLTTPERGTDPNRKSVFIEATPLQIAACRGDLSIVNELLRGGAHTTPNGIGNDMFRTAVEDVRRQLTLGPGTIAVDEKLARDLLPLLELQCGDVDALFAAVMKGHVEVVRALLVAGVRQESRITALAVARERRLTEITQLLEAPRQ